MSDALDPHGTCGDGKIGDIFAECAIKEKADNSRGFSTLLT